MPDSTDDDWGLGQDRPNKELVDRMPLILQCSACSMRIGLGDDPTNRALWEADFIENDGWARTAEGLLLCDDCATPREPRELAPPGDLPPEEHDDLPDTTW